MMKYLFSSLFWIFSFHIGGAIFDNVPSISEVRAGEHLGEATNGSETRYAVLGEVGLPLLKHFLF